MNDYKTPGNYYCATNRSADTLNNSPFGYAFTLKVGYSNGTGYPYQLYRRYDTGGLAYRIYLTDASPKRWDRYYYFSDDATIFGGTAINSGDDLNDYTTPGIYRSASSNITATLLNMPEVFGSGFSLLVLPISTVSNIQIILPSANGSRFYYRGSTTSEWNELWYKYIGTQIS